MRIRSVAYNERKRFFDAAPLFSLRPGQDVLGATANFEIMTREGGGPVTYRVTQIVEAQTGQAR